MVDDNPQDLVHDLAAEAVFGGHPLGRPVIGRAEVIASVSPRALRAYHGGAYVGPNVVLAAAGNVDHERLVELSQRAGRAPNGTSRVRRPLARAPAPSRATGSSASTPSSTTSCLAGPGIARDDERRYAVALLDAILGGSASSRLFQEIREKRGMAYCVYSYGSQYARDGPGRDLRRDARGQPLASASRSSAAELRDVGRGQPPRGRARAGEGEPRRGGCCSRSRARRTG